MSDLYKKIYADKATPPYAWIQWKGTDVCADIHCSCGKLSHIDANCAYYVKCPHCDQIYGLCGDIKLIPITQQEFEQSGAHKSTLIVPHESEE
jgi:phage terminase large subunit GpA-like protein